MDYIATITKKNDLSVLKMQINARCIIHFTRSLQISLHQNDSNPYQTICIKSLLEVHAYKATGKNQLQTETFLEILFGASLVEFLIKITKKGLARFEDHSTLDIWLHVQSSRIDNKTFKVQKTRKVTPRSYSLQHWTLSTRKK